MSGITVSQVHDFKGLENDYIILYGISESMKSLSKELYVGISRAKLGLTFMIKDSQFHSYIELLK